MGYDALRLARIKAGCPEGQRRNPQVSGTTAISSFPPPGRHSHMRPTRYASSSGIGPYRPFGCAASARPCRVELFTPGHHYPARRFYAYRLGSPVPRFVFGLVDLALRWSWGLPLTTPTSTSTAPDSPGSALCQSRNKFRLIHCPLAVGAAWNVATTQAPLDARRGPPGALFSPLRRGSHAPGPA